MKKSCALMKTVAHVTSWPLMVATPSGRHREPCGRSGRPITSGVHRERLAGSRVHQHFVTIEDHGVVGNRYPIAVASSADVETLAIAAFMNQLRMMKHVVIPAACAAIAPRSAPSFRPPPPG